MKIRNGFVSNSSSASFVLDKNYMTEEQVDKMRNYPGAEWDSWNISEDNDRFNGLTFMDNGNMEKYFKEINLGYRAVISYEGDEL